MPAFTADQSAPTTDWAALTGRLRRAAIALTGSRDQADDLVQQTLTVLLAKRPDRADHLGYARRTMIHLWLDQRRSLRRYLKRLARAASRPLPQWHVDPDGAEDYEQLRALRAAIDGLPPRQHAVLILRLIEGLSYDHIADALACPVQTVRANLHLARQRVRQRLGDTP